MESVARPLAVRELGCGQASSSNFRADVNVVISPRGRALREGLIRSALGELTVFERRMSRTQRACAFLAGAYVCEPGATISPLDLAQLAGRPGAGAPHSSLPISVIATCRNEVHAVGTLLDSILSELTEDQDELVVVDGGSEDGTKEILEDYSLRNKHFAVLSRPGTNISQGRNYAIDAAKNGIIVCVDFGCDYSAGFVSAMRAPFDLDPDLTMLVGVPEAASRSHLQLAQALACYPQVGTLSPNILERVHAELFGGRFSSVTPFARFMAFTKSVWKMAGGFPEDMRWAEDGEFGRRAASFGKTATTLEGQVLWHQRASLRETFKMYRNYGKGTWQSRRRSLIQRDALRAIFYPAILVLVARGPGSRTLALTAYVSYISLGFVRCLAAGSTRAALLVPLALLVKDSGKLLGEIEEALTELIVNISIGAR